MHSELDFRPVQIITGPVIYTSPYKYWPDENDQSAKVCTKILYFWPITASTTLDVKNDHAHVITQDICNQFIEINFCLGCMVSQPNCLFQDWTFVKYWWDVAKCCKMLPNVAKWGKCWEMLQNVVKLVRKCQELSRNYVIL